MVTVSSVKVSRDLGYADIYITLLGENDAARIDETSRCCVMPGVLRSQIANRIKLRHVPEPRFHYDESVVRGQRLSSLIDEAVADDVAATKMTTKTSTLMARRRRARRSMACCCWTRPRACPRIVPCSRCVACTTHKRPDIPERWIPWRRGCFRPFR